MINSRSLDELLPRTKDKALRLIANCATVGIDLIVTSTYRDTESQDALYAQGRTLPGKRVTNVRGGRSFHNHRVALDVVPVVNGKAIWDDQAMWSRVGAMGMMCGLEWGGAWPTFKDMPHFQDTNGLTIDDYIKG